MGNLKAYTVSGVTFSFNFLSVIQLLEHHHQHGLGGYNFFTR